MRDSLGAGARRVVPQPCEPPSRGKEQCGAALRGHACDDISRISFPVPQIQEEFIAIPLDVA